MKKLIAVTVALAIMIVPATAVAGKKKKGPAPYTESASIAMGHPVFSSASGSVVSLTAQEFINTCSVPATNGADAYVFEVPAEYQKIEAQFEVKGTPGLPYAYDIDVYTYDSSCAQNSAQNSAGTDQLGYLFKGTAYLLVHNYEPGPIDVELTIKP